MQKIPLSKCAVDAEVEEAALRALRSGHYILGPECEAFEAELAAAIGVKHCVLGSSCTMAVYLLHLAQGLKPGDEVIVPSLTAFPTIEPLIHCGAKPVFVDIDDTFCMDAAQAQAAITSRTVGIIPVHLYGHPADLDAIAARHNLWVMEDCAQAHGATYRGKPAGSIGLAGAFSFFPSKNLTVLGDGGCICSNDTALIDKIRMLRNHGRRDKYRHECAGFNIRFNEIQAAIGRVMLARLPAFNDNRRAVAEYYDGRLRGIVRIPPQRPWARAVYHMYVIRVERRDELQKFLKQNGIETGIHYPIPLHQQPAIQSPASLPQTEQAVREILSLPIHGQMTLAAAAVVCDAIEKFYGH
ncbi:MAG TPA: DegT/DnrJ/EryC1/StrS family aminotransferase [Verrucomicrobiae bacterium]|jgi:dTDP-4-amino-4,6-dideoxygalactose transaminase|nr:DegT/DnrJ/EryC1/StrS family aminotransferase [Verrucomicrobiae bacterium]